jgi:Domain of unknown function (DUF6436)
MDGALVPPPALNAAIGVDFGRGSNRPGAAVSIVVLWLAATVYAFWWFALKDIRRFDTLAYTHAGVFDASQRSAAMETWFRKNIAGAISPLPVATVVHVADPSCPCNRFSEPHFASIAEEYARKGVVFRKIDPTAPGSEFNWVKTTPAALVYDHAGRLAYFGPYSTGALCGAAEGLVERVLDHIVANGNAASQPLLAVGCYCIREEMTP